MGNLTIKGWLLFINTKEQDLRIQINAQFHCKKNTWSRVFLLSNISSICYNCQCMWNSRKIFFSKSNMKICIKYSDPKQFYHVTAVELLIASSNYAVKWKGLTFSPSVSSKTVYCTHLLEGCQHNASHFASSLSKLTEGQQFVFSIPVQFPASKFIFL